MAEPIFPNFRISNDVRLTNANIAASLKIREAEVKGPSSNLISSRIFNDATYQNVTISNVLQLCGVDVTSVSTDEQWDSYRQAAMRIEQAQFQQGQGLNTVWQSNTDETDIPMFIAMFSKTLNHDLAGRVIPSDYQTLRDGLEERDIEKISSVPNPGTSKLVQPLAAFNLNLVGPAPSSIPIPAAPSMSSSESAGEMVELYCQSLARDIPFVDFGVDGTIATMVGYLNSLSDFKGPTPVTPANIFRGSGNGDLVGPYISQLFFLDAFIWPKSITITTEFPTRTSANDRMISSAAYLSAQNGTVIEPALTLAGSETYLSTGRDLAYMVWQDFPGYLHEFATKGARDAGAPLNPLNPYLNTPLNNNQTQFITWSITDLRTCLQTAAQVSLSGAWYAKWVINRRLRPEAFGNEVEQWRLSGMISNPASINSDLLTSSILADVFGINGNNYLPQAYPEGAPPHPAYPSGHAIVSGACGAIMKAFLNENWVFPSPVVPNAAGTALLPIGDTLTLGGEINKLGSNIAIGRNWAGIHYRTDASEGILQGEQIAKLILQDWVNRYPEPGVSFSFHGYLGNEINITPQNTYGNNIQNPN